MWQALEHTWLGHVLMLTRSWCFERSLLYALAVLVNLVVDWIFERAGSCTRRSHSGHQEWWPSGHHADAAPWHSGGPDRQQSYR